MTGSTRNRVQSRPPAQQAPAGTGSTLTSVLAQQAAIAQFAQQALAEPRIEVLLAEAVNLVSRVLQTELVSVAQVEPEGDLRVVAGVGWRPGLVGSLRLPAGSGSQSGFALESGGTLVVEDLEHETRFRIVPQLLDHGAVSGVSVRIGEGQQIFGVLSAFTGRRGRFSRDDANFLQAVAGLLAVAVGRLRVEAELRHSRDELAAIVGSVRDGILVRGPDGRLLYANEPAAMMNRYSSPEALVNAAAGGSDGRFDLFDEQGRPVPLHELPSRVCLRTGQQTDEKLLRVHWRDTGEECWQVIQASPVHGPDGGVEKVVVVIRDITEERRALDARRFLAEALAVLSGVLDRTEQARQLAELCVPRIADYCSVDLLEPDGGINQLAEADTRGPGGHSRQGGRRRRDPEDAGTGAAWVIAHGRSQFVSDGRHELDLTSWLSVPLLAREQPIGALTLGCRAGSRPLDAHDLSLAEELGARTGILLESARLYEAAEDRLSELDAVLAAMADAVLVFDARGRLRLSNRAAEQLFDGQPPATMAQLREAVRVRDDSSREAVTETSVTAADATGDTQVDLEGELQLSSAPGWYELRGYRSRRSTPAPGGLHRPFVVVLRDITERRAAQAARDAFMGVLSHELRTPITTIYGGSELLARPLDQEQREEVLRDIRGESERLARLVEDLLVMTRVERGGVEIGDEPVLMQRLIPNVIGTLVARQPALRVAARVGEHLPAVRSDPTYLEQVLRNLLTNAMRYGRGLERGVEITADDAGAMVEVRVLDRGPGLEEEDVDQLFELFYRSPTAQLVPGGAGIGLFVCRRLIEAMGGRTWAQAREAGGAEFGFSLPVIELDPA